MTGDDVNRVGVIAERMSISAPQASKHKKRLLALGLIGEELFGVMKFQMPLLKEYLIEHHK
jgi:hypothetical protein